MKQPDLTIYVYFVVTWAMIYASRNILLVLPWVIDLLICFNIITINVMILVIYLKKWNQKCRGH